MRVGTSPLMNGMLSLESLTALVDAGEIDTVLAAVVDADGNLVGHRLHGRHFLDSAYREIRCSLRILTPDVPGNGSAHPGGTGDPAGSGADAGRPCTLRPDLATLRRAAWLPSSALVLCDVLDQQGHAPIHHSPRQMLIHQIARAANLGYEVRASTELQYRVFQNSYESTQQSGCIDPIPLGSHLSGFELHAPLARERLSGRLRRDLSASGLPVAGTIVSNEPGWERLILQHAGGLAAAGHHGIATLAARDIGEQLGTGVGFRAKRDPLNIGSSSRIQMSLWSWTRSHISWCPMWGAMNVFTAGFGRPHGRSGALPTRPRRSVLLPTARDRYRWNAAWPVLMPIPT